ncbi:CDP-archaeol synthase [Desulfosarcina cetonica]|uniref:CDP-archaeol synthase n=1 Tax=Desulfosarcina cetonica TaxID=90730 RepID=UPI0006CF65FA|nr:CDP-archaeol synthase [Desulfosarcina cetonica]
MGPSLKILSLLWLVNLAPPIASLVLRERFRTPVDGGCRLKDGRRLLGDHKTLRGVLAGITTGGLMGWLLGMPLGIGLSCGFLSMAGDLLTSFVKRRLGKPSGAVVAGLDQLPEGALPLLVLVPYARLGVASYVGLLLLFGVGAYVGSFLFTWISLNRTGRRYRRNLPLTGRLREWRACDTAYHPLHPVINVDRNIYYQLLMKTAFRLTWLYGRGRKNALSIRLNTVTFHFDDLPAAFDGYTILLLTDLHLDGLAGLDQAIISLVAPLSVDLCLFGGDYRAKLSGPYSKVLIRMRRLLHAIDTRDGCYAVLGNHDCIGMIPPLEKRGLRFLVNDAVSLARGEDHLWLVGIDDPAYYQAHDLRIAFEDVPAGAFTILLAHSPDVYDEAAAYGARLYLCGHTHAGQVQLPRIGPVVTHSRAPREYTKGNGNSAVCRATPAPGPVFPVCPCASVPWAKWSCCA